MFGFFSQKAVDDGLGTFYWMTPDKTVVEITTTSYTPSGDDYMFPDKEFRGEVVEFVRAGLPDRRDYQTPGHGWIDGIKEHLGTNH